MGIALAVTGAESAAARARPASAQVAAADGPNQATARVPEASTNDLFARAQAMGLNLSREDIERTRLGVAAMVKTSRDGQPAPSAAAAQSHPPASTCRTVTTPSSKPLMAFSSAGAGSSACKSSAEKSISTRPSLEDIGKRQEKEGEQRRHERQRRKSIFTPLQPHLAALMDMSIPSSSSCMYHHPARIHFSSPVGQIEPQPPSSQSRHATTARMSLTEVGIRAEQGTEEKRRMRRLRPPAEPTVDPNVDTSEDEDNGDMLPVLILNSTPDAAASIHSRAAALTAGRTGEDTPRDDQPSAAAHSPASSSRFPVMDRHDEVDDDDGTGGAHPTQPQTPSGSPVWRARSLPRRTTLSSDHSGEEDEEGVDVEAEEASVPIVAEAVRDRSESVVKTEPADAEGIERADTEGPEQKMASPKESATESPSFEQVSQDPSGSISREPDATKETPARPTKRRKTRRKSDVADTSAELSMASQAGGGGADDEDDADDAGVEEFMEAWDYADGTRVVKLVSPELAFALRAGTITTDEIEPRYYTLPAFWGQDTSKPTHASYAGLIGMAILSSSDGRLALAEIYRWISTVFPYYEMSSSSRGWRNSIRHNLSLNKSFYRTQRNAAEKGKGSLWSIQPGHECRFGNGTYNAKVAPVKTAEPGDAASHIVGASSAEDGQELGMAPGGLDIVASPSAPGTPGPPPDAATLAAATEEHANIHKLVKKYGGSKVLKHALLNSTSHKYYRVPRNPHLDVALGLAVPIIIEVPKNPDDGEGSGAHGDDGAAFTPYLSGDLSLPEAVVPSSQVSTRTDSSMASFPHAPFFHGRPISSTPFKEGGRTQGMPTSAGLPPELMHAVPGADTVAGPTTSTKASKGARGPATGQKRKRGPLKDKTNLGKVARAGGDGEGEEQEGGTKKRRRRKGRADAEGEVDADAEVEDGPKGRGAAKGKGKGKGKAKQTADVEDGAGEPAGPAGNITTSSSSEDTSSNVDANSPEAIRVRSLAAAAVKRRTRGPGTAAAAAAAATAGLNGPSGPSLGFGLGLGSGGGGGTMLSPAQVLAGAGVVPSNGANAMGGGTVHRWSMRSPISSLRSSMGAPLSSARAYLLGTGSLGIHAGLNYGGLLQLDDDGLFSPTTSSTAGRSPEDGHRSVRSTTLGGVSSAANSISRSLASIMAVEPHDRRSGAGLGAAIGGVDGAAGGGATYRTSRRQQSPLRGSPLRPSTLSGSSSAGSSGAVAGAAPGAASTSTAPNTAGALKNGGGGSMMLPIAGLTPARRVLGTSGGVTSSGMSHSHVVLGSMFSPLLNLHTLGGALGGGGGGGTGIGIGTSSRTADPGGAPDLSLLGMSSLRNMGIGANTGLGNVMSPTAPLSSRPETPTRGMRIGRHVLSSIGPDSRVLSEDGARLGGHDRGDGEGGGGGDGRGRRVSKHGDAASTTSTTADGAGGAPTSTGKQDQQQQQQQQQWIFSSTPIRRLMSGHVGSDDAMLPALDSPGGAGPGPNLTGSPYPRSGRSGASGSVSGSSVSGAAAAGAMAMAGRHEHEERGSSAAVSSSIGGIGTGGHATTASLGIASTPSAAVSRGRGGAGMGMGMGIGIGGGVGGSSSTGANGRPSTASTGLTPAPTPAYAHAHAHATADSSTATPHWLGDPFGYSGNFSHELAFTADMGGLGTGTIGSSPAKEMWWVPPPSRGTR